MQEVAYLVLIFGCEFVYLKAFNSFHRSDKFTGLNVPTYLCKAWFARIPKENNDSLKSLF